MMIYDAKIKQFNDIVEEEILVEIDGIDIFCFSIFHTPEMKIGESYPAEIELTVFDELEMIEIDQPVKELSKIGETFSYTIRGLLKNGILDAGIKFELDSEDLIDYQNLDGKYVEISGIDRINIDFPSKNCRRAKRTPGSDQSNEKN